MRNTKLCKSAIAFCKFKCSHVCSYDALHHGRFKYGRYKFPANQPQSFSAELTVNYPHCMLVHEQLHSALLELWSARTIISLLWEDFNKVNTSETTNIPMQSVTLWIQWI